MHHAAEFAVLHQYDADRSHAEAELEARRLADDEARVDGELVGRSHRTSAARARRHGLRPAWR